MLYRLEESSKLEIIPYDDFSTIGKKEKDLENIIAKEIGKVLFEEAPLMTIFQERQWQEEPDICTLDSDGNLVIFELKRCKVHDDTTLQIMRYSQKWGRMNYYELNEMYKKYLEKNRQEVLELSKAHMNDFDLEKELAPNEFNKHQKLVIVGNSSEYKFMQSVDYWKKQGLDIDFIPYRLYKIGEECYFELFSKPYDYHINVGLRKGILFDTNERYKPSALFEMIKERKVSAYGPVADSVNSFNEGDYVFYWHRGRGVVAAGKIIDKEATTNGEEKYRKIELLTNEIHQESDINSIRAKELKELLNKGFYFAKVNKVPYLSSDESTIVLQELKKRYNM